MSKKNALIYSPDFIRFNYGEEHPFKGQRYLLAYELMAAYGLTELPGTEVCSCLPVSEEALLTFHTPDYLARLKEFSTASEPRADFRFGLGDLENPVFPGLYDWACLGAAGTVEAARLVSEEGYDIAFNPAGGWHHAHSDKAAGFSYLNDAVIAINRLSAGGKRVAYLDIDAHHGDGVQEAFYDTDRVLTISLHEMGINFFPGTGFERETGTGKGKGYSVNVPLLAHTDDALFMKAFDEVAFPLIAAFDPDVLVTQIGVDAFRTDPLTRLEITTHSYSYVLRKLKALQIPWVATGGGGYDNINVARAWTIAWAIMNTVELPPRLPAPFVRMISELGFPHRMLLDAMHWAADDDRNRALDAVEKSIAAIRKTVFPVIIGGSSGYYGQASRQRATL
jgi:acetoin utilization protein AcuC